MYSKFTDKELLDILGKQKTLTFASQLMLRSELNTRGYSRISNELEEEIENRNQKIAELDYLKDIGFSVEKNEFYLKLTRSTLATIMDIFSIILGLICCYLGLNGLFGLLASIFGETELNLLGVVFYVLFTAIGYLGVTFLNGIQRLIDYSDFELIAANGLVTLKKRLDLKLVNIEKPQSELSLIENFDKIDLKLGDTEILSVSANNVIQSRTIKHLFQEIMKFS